MDTGRRQFLRGAALTREGRARAARQQLPLGPPPPWMPDLLQRNGCGGCDQVCASACEQDIIRFHPREHALAGFPYLAFSDAGCTLCGDCAEACPLDVSKDGSVPRLGRAQLERGRCLAWHDVICMSCVTACQVRALVRNPHSCRIAVAADRCHGCGMCVGVCPVDALAVMPDLSLWKRERGDAQENRPNV